MTNFKIIFIHGFTASSQADWYPNISKELEKLHVDFSIPDLPGGEYPKASEWLNIIQQEVKKTNKHLVLVGHSLGTRAVLLYLEKHQTFVEKVFLIAPLRNDIIENVKPNRKENYGNFFSYKIDLSKIKSQVKDFIVIHSKNDSSVPYKQGVELAKDLNAELITYEDRDHFSELQNAPIILETLRKRLAF